MGGVPARCITGLNSLQIIGKMRGVRWIVTFRIRMRNRYRPTGLIENCAHSGCRGVSVEIVPHIFFAGVDKIDRRIDLTGDGDRGLKIVGIDPPPECSAHFRMMDGHRLGLEPGEPGGAVAGAERILKSRPDFEPLGMEVRHAPDRLHRCMSKVGRGVSALNNPRSVCGEAIRCGTAAVVRLKLVPAQSRFHSGENSLTVHSRSFWKGPARLKKIRSRPCPPEVIRQNRKTGVERHRLRNAPSGQRRRGIDAVQHSPCARTEPHRCKEHTR